MPESPLSLSAESFSEVLSTGTVNTSFLECSTALRAVIPRPTKPIPAAHSSPAHSSPTDPAD